MMKPFRTGFGRLYNSLYFPPIIIVIAILVATGVTWRSSRQSLDHDVNAAINTRIDATEQAIRHTTTTYEEILQGGVGLFKGSSEVTSTDWNNFLAAFEIDKNYASAQAIGFIKIVPAADVDSFNAYMQSQGYADYAVHPLAADKSFYAPLTYAKAIALKTTPNYGMDAMSDTDRSNTLYRARDTGMTSITGRAAIIPLKEKVHYNGFVMYAPYYEQTLPTATIGERQSAIRGFAYASFRGDLFFGGIDGTSDNKDSGYRVTVGSDTTALYQSGHFATVAKRPHALHVTRAKSLYGRTWNIEYVFDRTGLVSEVQLRRPLSVVFAGAFTAGLIGLVVLLLLRSRSQELAVQKEQAVELAKDELLSLASHQLRTPATGVKQYLGMVLQGFAGKVPRAQKTLLEKAYASNDRQLSVINEILHLAKIDSGRIVLAKQPTDLNSLIEDIINEQRPDIAEASHNLIIKLPKKPLIATVDGHTLRMAIENILSNAIKYTPAGGEISVRMRHDENNIYIRIKDTGVGIAQSDIEKLFKQFSRLPNEMSLRVGGTGIGLYLAKHLVELHDGRIELTSQPGSGSLFTIVLPMNEN
ncbi:MAG: CHASE domain-containing protein [Candidatus Saccharimonadales bacterium]